MLCIHLPLNKEGNFQNQGLADVTVINNGATYDVNGKIGGCYKFTPGSNNSSQCMYLNKTSADIIEQSGSFSLACWFIRTGNLYSNGCGLITCNQYKNFGFGLYLRSNGGFNFMMCDETSETEWQPAFYSEINKWTHVCVTYDKITHQQSLYINGEYKASNIMSFDWKHHLNQKIYIGQGLQGGWRYTLNGSMNDVRIYDHCLSPKEVHEIAKGLVLHYQLNDPNWEGYTITKLNGKTLVWNQMFEDSYNVPFECDSGYHFLANGRIKLHANFKTGDKLFQYCKVNWDSTSDILSPTYNQFYCSTVQTTGGYFLETTGRIVTATANINSTECLRIISPSSQGYHIKGTITVLQVNLTQMFGAGNEPTVNQFKQMFPKEYYPYDPGSFLNYGGRQYEWNQMVKIQSGTNTVSGITFNRFADGTFSVTGTCNQYQAFGGFSTNQIKGHKYILMDLLGNNFPFTEFNVTLTTPAIFTSKQTINGYPTFKASQNTTFTGVLYKPIQIDLTQLFGEGNEPSTVEEFEEWITLNNITDFSYNPGEKRYYNFDTKWKSVGQNLFNINRSVIIKQSSTPSSEKTLSEDQLWNAFAYNGYSKNQSTNYTIIENSVSIISDTTYGIGFPIKLKPNTQYYLSAILDGASIVLGAFNKNGINITQHSLGKFTTGAQTEWGILRIASSIQNTKGTVSDIQLVYGDQKTKYTLYQSKQISWNEFYKYFPEGLRSANKVKDSIEFTDTQIIITKRIGKYILTGSESNYNIYSNNYIKTDCSNIAYNGLVFPNGSMAVECNKLERKENKSIWSTQGYPNCITLNSNNQTHINIPNSVTGIVYGTDTVETAKTKLKAYFKQLYDAGDPIIIYWELATPEVYILNYSYDTCCSQGILENSYSEAKDLCAPIDIETVSGVKNVTIYDVSGFKNNGKSVGFLQVTDDSPRYKNSIKNTSTVDDIIKAEVNMPSMDQLTLNWWGKYNDGFRNGVSVGSTDLGGYINSSNDPNHAIDYDTTAFNYRDGGWDMYNGSSHYRLQDSLSGITDNTWRMYTLVWNGSKAIQYVNGDPTNSITVSGALVPWKYLYIDRSMAGGVNRVTAGCWSDIRLYSTALSEDDIKELYNTSAIINNNNTLEAYEFSEDDTYSINKSGVLEGAEFIEQDGEVQINNIEQVFATEFTEI